MDLHSRSLFCLKTRSVATPGPAIAVYAHIHTHVDFLHARAFLTLLLRTYKQYFYIPGYAGQQRKDTRPTSVMSLTLSSASPCLSWAYASHWLAGW